MSVTVKPYSSDQIPQMMTIWNEVVQDGIAFPQEETLAAEEAQAFFDAQTTCGVAIDDASGLVLGIYILHPNNVGRCGHIANASYAVSSESRGKHIGEKLVRHSLKAAKEYGFRIMQFNAVVASNEVARRLYEKLGFVSLGILPHGFRHKDGTYEDICPYYIELA